MSISNRKIYLVPAIVMILLPLATSVGQSWLTNKKLNNNLAAMEKVTQQHMITSPPNTQPSHNTLKQTPLVKLQPETKTKNISSLVPERLSGATIYTAKFITPKKYIALTFDDGPSSKATPLILNILHTNNVKATFFLIGANVKQYPKLAEQIVQEGHAIGNHTWHHWYHYLNQLTAASEIDRTSNLIFKVTGEKTALFRPPGGILYNGLASYAKKSKYTVIMWSDDSQDYRRPPVNKLVSRVLKQAKPGGIVLMHDSGGNRTKTIAALPEIISQLKQQGYSFVTIPELLEIQEKQQKQPINNNYFAGKRTVKQLPTSN